MSNNQQVFDYNFQKETIRNALRKLWIWLKLVLYPQKRILYISG